MESGSGTTEGASSEDDSGSEASSDPADERPDAILEADPIELAELRCGISLGDSETE